MASITADRFSHRSGLMTNIRIFLASTAVLGTVVAAACTSEDPAPTTPIRSSAELKTYLRTAHDSPLDKMEPDARQRFLDSVVFGQHEIGGFEYRDLQALSADDVYQILHLFGAERTLPIVMRGHVKSADDQLAPSAKRPGGEDHEGFWCQSPHNCFPMKNVICMTGC